MATRPVRKNEQPNVLGSHDKVHPLGHVIKIYSDNAVFDETAGKFIGPEDVIRK